MEKNKPFNNQILIGEEKSEAIAHKDSSLKRLDISFNKHIELEEYKKSNLLAYWINDFAEYHDNEKTFDSHSLKRYKRGDIIKVNLGFNVGNELGGLHYCVVINNTDNLSFGTLNIIPLTSIKENKNYSSYTVNLGNELYNSLSTKINTRINIAHELLSTYKKSDIFSAENIDLIKNVSKELKYIQNLQKEINRMKNGSIALVYQITTISKQRIYNPKSKYDILSGIKLSNESLNLIDKKVIEIFTK